MSHDDTIGIPPYGYGQSYYTLRSIFCDRLPPPAIHMHIRKFDVASEVPIGKVSVTETVKTPTTTSNGHANGGVNGSAKLHASANSQSRTSETEIPEHERDKFDLWLRDLWREKDKSLTRYLDTGSLTEDTRTVEIPLELRSKREILDAFCFFIPALMGWIYTRFT